MTIYNRLKVEWFTKPENRICGCYGRLVECQKLATDIHHINGRTNLKLIKKEWWMSVCRHCHDWIGRNPLQAEEFGWLLRTRNDPYIEQEQNKIK